MAFDESDFNTATGNLLNFLNKELPNDFNEKYFEIQNIAKNLREEIWPTQDDENIDADFKSYILSDNGKDDLELYIELINNLYKQRGVVLDGTSGNALEQEYLLGLMTKYKQAADNNKFMKNDSKEVAEKLFPSEKWTAVSASSSASIFISETRRKDGKKDMAVYESDKMMALTLAEKSGKNVFMPPERSKGKNPDCIFDGDFLEMKHVRGDQRKVGKNAINALSQSENVFLYIDKPTSIEECLSSVKGYYSNNKKKSNKRK